MSQQRGGRSNNNSQRGGGQQNRNNNQRPEQRNNNQRPEQRNNNQRPEGRKEPNPLVTGLVRAVPSGDTVVLVNPKEATTNGPPKERQLTFLSLKAPLLGRKNKEGVSKDAPFAWESREFLRKMLIGKSVVYRVEHEANNRCYGEVFLNGDVNVRNRIVEEGWAEVTAKKEKKEQKEGAPQKNFVRREDLEYQELVDLMESAKDNKRGMWDKETDKAVRKVKYNENLKETNPEELFAFFEKHKGKTLQGIVEQVRTGTTLRVYVPSIQEEFTVYLCGVHSPVYKFNDESNSEPFSREAKFFTEHCLLNRDVTVTLQTMDKFNNYYGVVLDSLQSRNIGLNLLKQGLAEFVDWNAPSDVVSAWKEAEKVAKNSHLRIWEKTKSNEGAAATYVQTSQQGNLPKEFLGTVVEVVNAGTVVVRITKGDEFSDVNVTLSSIKPPRASNKRKGEAQEVEAPVGVSEKDKKIAEARKQKAEDEKVQDAYAHEGREWLRKTLIGKKVRCSLDYVQAPYTPPNADKPLPARLHYSVYNGKNNVALELVRKGLVNVALHQPNDPRSPDYSAMNLAEKAALSDAVGLFAPKSRAPIVHINDLTSQPEAKCRHFLGSLKRAGTIPGVVEIPFSGTRFKVYLPSQGLTVAFGLQGCYSEKPQKTEIPAVEGQPLNFRKMYPSVHPGTKEPLPGNSALLFARDHLYQRDVEVTIDEMDRFGTFLGKITVNKADFTLKMIQAGLARVNEVSVGKLANGEELKKAQNIAKNAKTGIWWNYDEAVEKEKEDQRKAKRDETFNEESKQRQGKSKSRPVSVTDVMTGSTFYYQLADDESKSFVEDMMADFASRDWDVLPSYAPGKKEWVAGKFSVDGSWYRAEVLRVVSKRAPPSEAEAAEPKPAGKAAAPAGKSQVPAGKGGQGQGAQGAKPVAEVVKKAPKPSTDGLPPEELLFEVRYIDYGNTELVDYKNIRKLDPVFSDTTKYPAFAHKGKLAYIRAPSIGEEFGEDAAALLKELVWGKIALSMEQFTEGTGRDAVNHMLLGVPEGDDVKPEKGGNNINGFLVMRGLARVETKTQPRAFGKDIYKILIEEQDKAKAKRLCIWQYGEIPDSDEERQWANMLK